MDNLIKTLLNQLFSTNAKKLDEYTVQKALIPIKHKLDIKFGKSYKIRQINQHSLLFNTFGLGYDTHPILPIWLVTFKNIKYVVFIKGQTYDSQAHLQLVQQELVYLKSSNSTKSLLNNDIVFDTNQVYYIKLNELQNHININDIRNAQSAYFDKYDKFLIFNQIKQNMQSNDFSISEVSMFFGQGLKIIPIVFSNKIIQSDKIRLKLYLKKMDKIFNIKQKICNSD